MNPYYKLYVYFLGPKILTEIETLKAKLKKGALAHFGSEGPSSARAIGSPGVRKSPRPPVWDKIPGWKPSGICCLVIVMFPMLYSMGRSANSVGTVPKKMPR